MFLVGKLYTGIYFGLCRKQENKGKHLPLFDKISNKKAQVKRPAPVLQKRFAYVKAYGYCELIVQCCSALRSVIFYGKGI